MIVKERKKEIKREVIKLHFITNYYYYYIRKHSIYIVAECLYFATKYNFVTRIRRQIWAKIAK